MSVELRFWGVRGSIPTPEAQNLGYGGNTACIEVRCEERTRLVLDAGTGIRRLGLALTRDANVSNLRLHLCLTHFHWDHIQGLPFFAPLYQSGWEINFFATSPSATLQRVLRGQMRDPYFGAESAMRAECQYLQAGADGLKVGPLVVRSFPLHHPGGAVGYRVETPNGAIVYATDHEHGESTTDESLLRQCLDADVLIYDSQYTPEEYERRRGWGHSTWAEAVRLARNARVGKLILFHHDPEHDDAAISRIERDANAEFPNTIAAREGLSIDL